MKAAAGHIVNNIDLDVVQESRRAFEKDGGHHAVEKTVEGEYSLGGSPSFTAALRTDASTYVVPSDEPRILGGRGAQVSPLTYVLYGVVACFANTVAIQAGLKGVKLGRMKVSGRLSYDIGPVLTGLDSPLIRKLEISVEADRDLSEVIRLSRKRCPALFLVNHAIQTHVGQAARRKRKT